MEFEMTSTHAVADSPSSEVPRTTDKGDVKQSSTEDYPGGFRLLTITFALCLAVFCVALDNTVCGDDLCSSLVSNRFIDHCDSHSKDHRRLRGPQRCRLVWLSLPSHDVL